MNTIRITKRFSFEAAHALYGYDGLCKNIHGHSYKLWVTISGVPIDDETNSKYGMLIDFDDLKTLITKHIVSLFNHAIILNCDSPHKAIADDLEAKGHKILRVTYQPTCERIIIDFVKILRNQLPDNVTLVKLKLKETENNFAEWHTNDNISVGNV